MEVLLAARRSDHVDGCARRDETHDADSALSASCSEEARSVGALCDLLHRSMVDAIRAEMSRMEVYDDIDIFITKLLVSCY